MTEIGALTLVVTDLEVSREATLPFADGAELCQTELRKAFQLVLREECWCRFQHPAGAFVHFGHDYYMYVGTPRDCPEAKQVARERLLFVEPVHSPYRDLASE